MSIQRLDMLKKQLDRNGWDVRNLYSDDLYYVVGEHKRGGGELEWEISRGCYTPVVLSFFIPPNYSFLPWSSEILNNIFSCTESKNGNTLYFDKIKSKEWEANLKNWVNKLSAN